jgi:hypothetical protein
MPFFADGMKYIAFAKHCKQGNVGRVFRMNGLSAGAAACAVVRPTRQRPTPMSLGGFDVLVIVRGKCGRSLTITNVLFT